MFVTDYIRVYENGLPLPPESDLCNEIIRRFDASPNIKDDVEHPEGAAKPIRSYQEVMMNSEGFADIQTVMMKLAELTVAKYHNDVPLRTFPKDIGCETYRMIKYRAGTQDRFAYHVDVSNHASARRFMGITWFLNDVERGGDYFFPIPNLRVQPKKGRVLVYPSLWMYPHSVEPALSEDCYMITTFLHYL